MKKLVPFALTVLFLFNLAGYYMAFPVMSWCLKESKRAGMEAGILQKQLVLIKIPVSLTNTSNSEFQMTDGDEFQYKGKMYDVSSKEIKDGVICFYCYADNDEDQLNAGLDNHIKADTGINTNDHKNGNQKTSNSLLKEYLKTGFRSPDIAFACLFPNNHFISGHIISLKPDILVPPPKS